MKPITKCLIFCFTLILSAGFFSPSNAQSELFSYEKFVNNDGESLLYRKLEADYNPSRKYPLVIFLHGSGERGNDNEAQLKWGVLNFATHQNMKLHPCIVLAPQCPTGSQWSNFSDKNMELLPNPSTPMKLVLQLIKQSIKNLPVDTNRIYITGLSMGGFGTYDAIMRQPNWFAAAVPVCGGGDINKAQSIAHIPMWIFHGAEDSVVDPILSQNMVRALTEAGAHPGFTQFPEVGHFSWIGAFDNPLMMEWLFQQNR